MQGNPKYSIIVPVYNSQNTIGQCLDGLICQTIKRDAYEILLVDDGSTDDTARIVENYPEIRYLPVKHGGPAAARNAGSYAARGEILAFTDSDCIPAPDWLEKLTAPFENPKVVGVKGAYRSQQKSIMARFVQLEYEYKYRRMAEQPSIDFIDTYSAAYQRDIFLKNGGFEISFSTPSVEDQELSFRLASKGYLLVFEPEAIVFHKHDANIKEYFYRKTGIGYWKAYMLRWLPQKTFTDSHTSPSQRWQIVSLAFGILMLAAGIFIPAANWFALLGFVIFIFISLPFISFILKRDLFTGLLSLPLTVIRAAALGGGLFVGFLFPPAKRPFHQRGLSMERVFLKRILDTFGSLVGLLISAPIMLIAAIAIKLDSPGPVFFVQVRAGENGKPFKMIKLRTMVNGAEQQVHEVMKDNSLQGPVFKIPNDPRITRVGRCLRRWSLDEIPQFWNVFVGDMSLVGPRPEEVWIVALYNDQQRQRLQVKPGITGPMQINGRGYLDMEDRLRLELEYIEHYSIWKDFSILLASIPSIITGNGAI
jgi:lipopolysaccharide/colanic/teichoic acid biosynthesis glycosyltransferase/GT2 family glycosyltransferase